MKQLLVGIDDTDVKDSRGTGYKARMLAKNVIKAGLGEVPGISRHQLLVDPRIPYTSHNSSACLEVRTDDFDKIREFCRDYLMNESEDGSDAGLCIAELSGISDEIIHWGMQAKITILEQHKAVSTAKNSGIYLEGFKGTHGGIIGAMAAVGLRAGGNDGRLIWLDGEKNLRDLQGIYLISDLKTLINIDGVINKDGRAVRENEVISLGEWLRPVIRKGKILILAEEVTNNESYEWESAHKDFVRAVS